MSNDEILERLRQCDCTPMTPEQQESQKRSMVYGNTKIENEHITPELVNAVGEELDEYDRAE